MSFTESRISIDSGGLRLEGALHEGKAHLAAVVLHPHPQYGGDMDSHVVVALCRAFADLGATTMRFNFRGAGGSEGTYEGGAGEAADAMAAIGDLRARKPGAPIVLAGYSFGAAIAASVAADARPDALVLASLPGQAAGSLPDDVPMLVVTGENDQIAPPAQLRALESPNRQLVVLDGVDHFWWPGVDRLVETVREFVGNLRPEQ